jgi:MFS family permease
MQDDHVLLACAQVCDLARPAGQVWMVYEVAPSETAHEPEAGRRTWLLPILMTAVFMTTADNSIVNVAVPSIAVGLRASGGELELAVSAYILAYAVLLVTGARLGSIFGYRGVFLTGLVLFTLGSLACGLAPDAMALILARILQGIGAAVMVPQVLSAIQLSFDGTERARALALYPVALAGGAAAGQVLGGALISLNVFGSSWRPVFLVNVPIGVALLVLGTSRLPADHVRARERLDVMGVATLTVATLLLAVPLMLGRDQGWPGWMLLLLGACVPAFALFVAVEGRVASAGGHPLLRLGLFRRSAISWGLAAQALATVTYAALLFVLAIYLQDGLGKSPLYSGLAVLSWVIGFGVSGPTLRWVPERFSARVSPFGFTLLGAVFLAIAVEGRFSVPQGMPLVVLLGFGGLGMGVGFSSLIGHLTAAVTPDTASDLSGVVSTNSELASVLGVAVFGTLYLALAQGHDATIAVDAFALVAAALGGAALLAAVAAARSVRGGRVHGVQRHPSDESARRS